jgi:hypothetical protein
MGFGHKGEVRKHAEIVINLPLCFRYSVIEDGSLVIRKLRMEDSGMFQCLAANEAGEDSVYTWLKVKSKTLSIFINKRMVLLSL